jgi:hypothetical protein
MVGLKEDVMLIYLVRWPDLSASLVQAESEEHLLDILDQVGNSDDCESSINGSERLFNARVAGIFGHVA